MISSSYSRLVVSVVLLSLIVWTQARKFTVLRLIPDTTAEVELLHSLLMNDVKLDFWKAPTEPGREVHVMMDELSKKRFISTIQSLNMTYSVMIGDVQKWGFLLR
ncbi:unnamed protein product [Nippostrongylus brasiliensis]|uniref:Propep_M14 domain-containing protein n=1 Tax=Nippostrongylus brasiliensis TaxID=27835 RepID=A0A158R0H0_NIPBR|nr:unnamed protein product [Nippostrongylus brasiliensis]